MNKFLAFTNFSLILVLSQVYLYFSIFRLHLLLCVFIFSIIGVLIGIYISFQTNEYIKPNKIFDQNNIEPTYILSFEFYSDLVSHLTSTNERRKSINKRKSKSELSESEFDQYFLENDYLDSNDEFLKLALGSTNSIFGSIDDLQEVLQVEENKTESNSKLDTYLEEMAGLIVRDFLVALIEDLIWEKEKFSAMAKKELKQLISNLRKNLRELDSVKIISRDLIIKFNNHFFNISKCKNSGEKFKLNFYEMDQEKEIEHLRKIVEIFLLVAFDEKSYMKNNSLRSFIKEALLNKIILPMIDLMCDPDYLNQRLITYLSEKENQAKLIKRTFSHAANYEEFIKMIKSSKDLEEMKQFYFKIMNEIMQATIISEFKDSQNESKESGSGQSTFYAQDTKEIDGESSNKHSDNSDLHTKNTKAEMLRSRNLKAYLKQLRFAKTLCERRLAALNTSMMYIDDDVELVHGKALKNKITRKILQFDVIINSTSGQINFLKFLEPDGSDHLLRFWIDVEKLKQKFADIRKKYNLANRIYENYLKSYDSPVRDEIGKDLVQSMRLFLLGNNTDESFFKAQNKIQIVLESDYYPSFIVTELYEKLIPQLETKQFNSISSIDEIDMNKSKLKSNEKLHDNEPNIKMDQNKRMVNRLKEKLQMKLSALDAHLMNKKQEDSKIVDVLDADIRILKRDITMYESHIHKTKVWCENMGKWRTSILKARITQDDIDGVTQNSAENILLFEIQVQLLESLEASTSGWFIFKSLKEFETLHENLQDICSNNINVLFKKILSFRKHLSGKHIDQEKIKQATFTLDDYLRCVSEDESLSQSEALYTFLCPSTPKPQTDEKFSIGSMFKNNSKSKEATEDQFLDQIFEDYESKSFDSNEKDSIAEPFYHLLEELFELKGMKKWFRKSLILFVQLTYGATINRKIRECVYYIFSEEMLAFYLKNLKDSMWINKNQTDEFELIQYETKERSTAQKAFTKKEAKQKLLANMPDALQKLVGEKNTQIGLLKLFETFQDKKLNKHLVYSLLELLIDEMCPCTNQDQEIDASQKLLSRKISEKL